MAVSTRDAAVFTMWIDAVIMALLALDVWIDIKRGG